MIEKMPVFKKFPAEKGQSRLVQWIENKIYKIVSRRINWLLDRVKDDSFEITASDAAIEADGNWRLFISGTDLLIQRRESGAWVTKFTIAA